MGLPQTENGNEQGVVSDQPPLIGDEIFATLDSLPESPQASNPRNTAPVNTPAPGRPNRETRRTSVPAIDGVGPYQALPLLNRI